jgi:hypothetical protein
VTAEQAKPIIADLMGQVEKLEKTDKWADAQAKIEEIQKRFDKRFWPEGLEERRLAAKKKADAVKFFGLDPVPPKAPEKTP